MANFAIKGYEVDALDFMVKPVRYFTFSVKLDRAVRSRERLQRSEVSFPVEGRARRIFLRDETVEHELIYL